MRTQEAATSHLTMTFTDSRRLASDATVSQKCSVLTATFTVRATAAAVQNGRGGRAGFLGSNQNDFCVAALLNSNRKNMNH